jgi:hypothetical protein
LIYTPREGFEARRVDPMYILKDHQHWTLACQSRQLASQGFKGSLPALLWRQIERRITPIIREGQHLGKERHVLFGGQGLRKQSIKLIELGRRGFVTLQSRSALHLTNDWVQSAVGVLRGAKIPQSRVRLAGETIEERGR